ncbi:MAG: imidazole glycerol phosphate synthase subunit HisH [Actinomycetes bacterium]
MTEAGRTGAAPSVAVLDYGSGNLHSATRALAAAGADVVLTADADACLASAGLVVPGVGAFAACMAGLEAVEGPRLIRERLAAGRPVLGICVGHQVMFARGVEHGVATEGVGVLPGVVERLVAPRLPHMGWNTVEAAPGSVLFAGVADQRFYFVHSYAVRSLDPTHTTHPTAWPDGIRVTWAEHGGDRFVAAIEHGALSATQFHPEKSGHAGGRLLRNWVAALPRPS